jgi:hypothetical protein
MSQKKHWNKFKHAAKDIIQLGQDSGHPEIKMVCDGTAALINSKVPKFYIPNVKGLLSEKDAPPEGEMYNLPYPIVCLLSETKIISKISDDNTIIPADDPAWVLTIAIQKETNGYITLMSATSTEGRWTFSPIAVHMQRDAGAKTFSLGINMNGAAEEVIRLVKADMAQRGVLLQESIEDTITKDYIEDMHNVCTLCSLLGVHDTKTVKVPMPTALKRTPRRGETSPDYDYHVLSVGGEIWDSPWTTESDGESGVRSHLRRGHIRRLASKTVWVRATFVRGSREGFVEKDYEVKGNANALREQTPSV